MANVNLLLGPLLSCYSYRLQVLSGSPEMNLVYTVKKKKKKFIQWKLLIVIMVTMIKHV